MKPWTIDELRELAPGFVMGTLTSDELALFNAAMTDPATAAELQPECDAHRAALEFLATEVAVTPPPSLRQRLQTRIADENRAHDHVVDEVPLSLAETVEAPVMQPSLTLESASDRRTGERRATRVTPPYNPNVHRRRSAPAWITTGVFGLAMAASLFFALNLRGKVQGLEGDLSREQRLSQKVVERLAGRDSILSLLTHSEANLALVTMTTTDSARSLQVFWNKRTGDAIVHASGFAQVAKDRTYVLWLIRSGKPEAVKLFVPDADGHRLMNAVAIVGGPDGVTAFAVTEEPAAGSPQPTMTPFLVGTVAPK